MKTREPFPFNIPLHPCDVDKLIKRLLIILTFYDAWYGVACRTNSLFCFEYLPFCPIVLCLQEMLEDGKYYSPMTGEIFQELSEYKTK